MSHQNLFHKSFFLATLPVVKNTLLSKHDQLLDCAAWVSTSVQKLAFYPLGQVTYDRNDLPRNPRRGNSWPAMVIGPRSRHLSRPGGTKRNLEHNIQGNCSCCQVLIIYWKINPKQVRHETTAANMASDIPVKYGGGRRWEEAASPGTSRFSEAPASRPDRPPAVSIPSPGERKVVGIYI